VNSENFLSRYHILLLSLLYIYEYNIVHMPPLRVLASLRKRDDLTHGTVLEVILCFIFMNSFLFDNFQSFPILVLKLAFRVSSSGLSADVCGEVLVTIFQYALLNSFRSLKLNSFGGDVLSRHSMRGAPWDTASFFLM